MKRILFLLTGAVLLLGCTGKDKLDTNPKTPANAGTLAVKLTPAGSFTKAADDVSVADFKIAIKDTKGAVVQSWDKYSEVPEVISLQAGTYTLEATSPGDKEAEFDQPIYAGSTELNIKSSELTSAQVVCTLRNMKVSVVCSEKFLREVKNYTIMVSQTNAPANFLIFDSQETRSGYFTVAPLTVQVDGIRALDNTSISQTATITQVAARDHHILKLNAIETGTAGLIGITIDPTTNNRDEIIEIPGEDETPIEPTDPDDPSGGEEGGGDNPGGEETPAPVVSGPGFETPLTLTDAAAEGASVDISISTTSPATIQQLWVEIDSPELTPEELGGIGIESKFDLANLSPEMAAVLGPDALGLIGTDPVKGSSSFSFSIGTFMALLHGEDDGSVRNHRFHITVVDSNDKVTKKTLTVIRLAE